MTNITAEKFNDIWNALEYTRATIGRNPSVSTTNPDYVEIHRGRACQSYGYLDAALKALKELREIVNDD